MKYGIFCITFITFFTLLTLQVFSDEPTKSTIDDQQSVEVTIYNSNLGLVKDVRSIKLPKGEGRLKFMDVASGIMPVTVQIVTSTDC